MQGEAVTADPPRPLFRAEAQRDGNLQQGAILLARPVSFTWATLGAVVILLAVLTFFLVFSTSETVRVPGTIAPVAGVITIVASQTGRMVERHVVDGQSVLAGQALFALRSERVDAQGRSVGDVVSRLLAQRRDSTRADSRLQQDQFTARQEALRRRLPALSQDLQLLEEALVLSRQRLALDTAALERQRQLMAHGMGTLAAFHAAEATVIDARQQLVQQRRAIEAVRRDQALVRQELRQAEFQHGRDTESAARALASIDREVVEHEAARAMSIRAPAAGRVAASRAEVGHLVSEGEVLAQLWPVDGDLEADLRATSRAAAFLRPGMAVRVHVDAFPHARFGAIEGRVRDIDLVTSSPPGGGGTPAYRVRVRLPRQSIDADGVERPLRPGMTLEAVVPLERRRLYEWAIDPLKRLSPTGPVAGSDRIDDTVP